MSGWIMTVAGLLVAAGASTIAVGAAAASRLELARWISQRLRGAAIASALLSTPGRVLASANAVAAVGWLFTAMGLNAVLAGLPPLLRATVVVLLAVPLLIAVASSVPRAAGHRWPEWVVRRGGPLMEWVSATFGPLLPSPDSTPRASLTAVVRAGQQEGVLGADELTVFSGVVAFAERTVREVMTPRTHILAVPENAPLTDVARMLGESGYSRLPVYRESLDNIIGMVYAFDLLKVAPDGVLPVRPVSVVPASKRCADLLFEMQRERRQFAVVLDEFGGTAGIATFENLLEELVGEIFEEPDRGPSADSPAPDLVEVDAAMPASEIAARFGVTLPREAGTLGGLLARGAGRIPQAGERFALGGLEFDVLAATPTRVERVAVRRGPVPTLPLGAGGRP